MHLLHKPFTAVSQENVQNTENMCFGFRDAVWDFLFAVISQTLGFKSFKSCYTCTSRTMLCHRYDCGYMWWI